MNHKCVDTKAAVQQLHNALDELQIWCQESEEASCLMNVSDTIPDGMAVVDCGAALDCTGEQTAARTAQALEAQGETRIPECVDKCQDVRFGTGEPQRATFAVSFPVTLGDNKSEDKDGSLRLARQYPAPHLSPLAFQAQVSH